MSLHPVQIACHSTDALVDYMAYKVKSVVPITPAPLYFTNGNRTISVDTMMPLPTIETFIRLIIKNCQVSVAILLFAILYLVRLGQRLNPIKAAKGKYDTPYRLLLAAILISSKYLCEAGTHLTSRFVANQVRPWYTCQELNRMERSFLVLLGYDLWVSPWTLASFVNQHGCHLKLQLKNQDDQMVITKHDKRAAVDMNHDSLVLRGLSLDANHLQSTRRLYQSSRRLHHPHSPSFSYLLMASY